jgi:acetoacetyl-CoA synthetase
MDRPVTLTETVTACFERVLRCPSIDPDDSFFDLGGDSLLALSFLLEIKHATGRELPLAVMYDAATIKKMVALIEHTTLPEFSPVVPFRTGTSSPPIFMVHGIFGNVVELLEVSKHLPTDRAVYGLQPRGLDGRDPPYDRVEAMAEYYLEAITRVQPRGPYILVGYSFGGLIAMEMATRILARGDQIAILCLVDTYPNPRYWPILSHLGIWRRRGIGWMRGLAGMKPMAAMAMVWNRIRNYSNHGLRAAATAQFDGDVALPVALQRVREANYTAFMSHKPPQYDGSVMFLKAGTSYQFPGNPKSAWRHFLTNLSVHTLPGDHYSMIGAHVDSFGRFLCSCVERALETTQPNR